MTTTRAFFVVIFVLCLAAMVGSVLWATTSFAGQSADELIAARREQLEKDLAGLEKLIAAQQTLLQGKRGERVSLERDVDILDAQIETAQLAIRAQRIVIEDLEDDIVDKEITILELSEKIDSERESLAGLIRRTAELDEQTLVEVIFSQKTISEFFEEIDDFEMVKEALKASSAALLLLRDRNEAVRLTLEDRKETEGELKSLKEIQEAELQNQENQKSKVLRETKGEEARYQQLITQNERSAAQIRSELFELRGSAAINLGDAIEFATFAGLKTRVRPALILGILKQETRLGEFLGNGSYLQDMKQSRDVPLFLAITKSLGLDPRKMPVSAKPSYGWGGAMGPAQFIPSTWACYGGYINTRTNDCNNSARSYEWDTFWQGPWVYRADSDRIRVVRGKQSPSNPWDNQDAFIGSALLMQDNGAGAGGYQAERTAALRYFAGWVNASNPAYAFYGDGVMTHAAYYQKQIDALKRLSD